MDKRVERIVIDTEVARREEGILVTLHYDDGTLRERYLSQIEARDVIKQIERQLSHSAGEKP